METPYPWEVGSHGGRRGYQREFPEMQLCKEGICFCEFDYIRYFSFLNVHLFFLNFFKCLIFFLRQRQSMSGDGAEKEGDTESEVGSRF